jgi:hypothetical protein
LHNSVLFYPDVTTGCSRFDTPAEYAALIEVYRCLCPLYNYWYPSFKLVSKEKQADGRYKKVYGKGRKRERPSSGCGIP